VKSENDFSLGWKTSRGFKEGLKSRQVRMRMVMTRDRSAVNFTGNLLNEIVKIYHLFTGNFLVKNVVKIYHDLLVIYWRIRGKLQKTRFFHYFVMNILSHSKIILKLL